MHIQLETQEIHTISAYDHHALVIQGKTYNQSLIVSAKQLISPWPVRDVKDLDEHTLKPALALLPEILLVACEKPSLSHLAALYPLLQGQRIALEAMTHDAAYRTYNVLLSEGRPVALCVIFN